jgi:cystathionine gamma-synthase/cystathionine gamma-lyase/cystathionine beta-lyase
VFYLESITNPWLDVPPLRELADFARANRLLSIIDNTLLSPVNFRPADMGFDIVIHSASKSLNGHTDIVAGVVAGNGRHIACVRKMMNLAGVCLDPHACFLLERGLKTLPLRVRVQNHNAESLARAVAGSERVAKVRYPGLLSDPSYAPANDWFNGFGNMVTFYLTGDGKSADRVLSRLNYAEIAPSLGGVETLVCRPITTSHAGLSGSLQREMDISEDMVRVSVGIEDADDLIGDFMAALAS